MPNRQKGRPRNSNVFLKSLAKNADNQRFHKIAIFLINKFLINESIYNYFDFASHYMYSDKGMLAAG